MRLAPDPINATLSLPAAAGRAWDVLIVGAGPAGASAAIGLGRRSLRVLLVDKAGFPRGKVCGCCLNATAAAALVSLGLGDPVARFAARPIRELRLSAGRRRASIRLAGGSVLSRETLDAALVQEAIRAGVHFLPQTLARLVPVGAMPPEEPTPGLVDDNSAAASVPTESTPGAGPPLRAARLQGPRERVEISAQVILVADGLAGRFLADEPGYAVRFQRGSMIGVGATLDAAPAGYEPGIVYMACGNGGYVGLTCLEDARLDVAAAIEPHLARAAGGPPRLVAAILREAGLPPLVPPGPVPDPAPLWHGTPRLSRRRRVAGERILVLGDSAGYVEPFTGEGIAWALTSGLAVVPIAAGGAARWSSDVAQQWTDMHHRLLGPQQWACRLITRGLRRPALTRAAVAVLAHVPSLSGPLVRRISAQSRLPAIAP